MAVHDCCSHHHELADRQKEAVAFLNQLSICMRQVRAYGAGHPVVCAAVEKALELLLPVTQNGECFTLGVARHAFMVGDEFLERQNVKLVQYASLLSGLGILTLTFSAGLPAAELHRFSLITGRSRDEVWQEGGIGPVFVAAGMTLIVVQGIDPSLFSLCEAIPAGTQRTDPWERLLRSLLDVGFPISREKLLPMLSGDPAQLAAALNSLMAGLNDTLRLAGVQSVAQTLADFARHTEQSKPDRGLMRKLVTFVANLSPQLRRDFLATFLITSQGDTRLDEEFFELLPDEMVSDALNATLAHGAGIPQLVLKLMHRLTVASAGSACCTDSPEPAQLEKGLQVLLRKDEFEKYVPAAYQAVLAAIISDGCLGDADEVELVQLRETLHHDRLEAKTADVIMEIMRTLPPEEQGGGLQRSLAEMAAYFLGNGDFRTLAKVLAMVHSEELLRCIFTPACVIKVFNGLALGGHDRQREVHDVLVAAGRPFVVPLLERLALEHDRSLRRFCFDCLRDLGTMARDAALERLQDERWFFVRNLLVLLRAFPDHEVQRAVRRCMEHPHPKVRHEALKNILLFQDPLAEQFHLRELENNDVSWQIAAIQLAESTRSQAVIDKLFALLDRNGFRYHQELKCAIVATLAAIGEVKSLPRLERILRSHNLFHPVQHGRLKREIVNSLACYPATATRSLIDEFGAGSGPRPMDQSLPTMFAEHDPNDP
jgi:hypothetical protein